MGEKAIRFSPNGGSDFVDVCPLCQEIAVDYGWIKEGSPTSPTVPNQRRRRRRGLASLLDPRRQPPDDPVVSEPILRRLSVPEQQMVGRPQRVGDAPVRTGRRTDDPGLSAACVQTGAAQGDGFAHRIYSLTLNVPIVPVASAKALKSNSWIW